MDLSKRDSMLNTSAITAVTKSSCGPAGMSLYTALLRAILSEEGNGEQR